MVILYMTPRADDDVYTSFMAILPAVDDDVQCVNMSCSMDKCVVGVGGGGGGFDWWRGGVVGLGLLVARGVEVVVVMVLIVAYQGS